MTRPAARRLTRDDWAAAAAAALATGGLAAVAVEPIAARLGATKGSFYWHFANRDDLVRAALGHWEHRLTIDVLDRIETLEVDPATRLRLLIQEVTRSVQEDRIALALLADADHPIVGPVLARVAERRVSGVAHIFEELGFSPDQARRRALLAHSAYLGHAYLTSAAPPVLPPDHEARVAYLDEVLAVLTVELPRVA
ncbi:TetR/AcrR family transcriptional regulator [Plantactinospora sp. GCM10030261]|uniref:TetR/AcrR family transcriptional regulator n=1 Tax=Plantactinospora sp. GCM10030261 TaxID=3273420 RepID=UPI00361AD2D7